MTAFLIYPLPQDRRFADEAWRGWRHNLIHQSFLLKQHGRMLADHVGVLATYKIERMD